VLESNSGDFRVLLVTLCRQSVHKSFSTKGLRPGGVQHKSTSDNYDVDNLWITLKIRAAASIDINPWY